jgi:hypothetical protein
MGDILLILGKRKDASTHASMNTLSLIKSEIYNQKCTCNCVEFQHVFSLLNMHDNFLDCNCSTRFDLIFRKLYYNNEFLKYVL